MTKISEVWHVKDSYIYSLYELIEYVELVDSYKIWPGHSLSIEGQNCVRDFYILDTCISLVAVEHLTGSANYLIL